MKHELIEGSIQGRPFCQVCEEGFELSTNQQECILSNCEEFVTKNVETGVVDKILHPHHTCKKCASGY